MIKRTEVESEKKKERKISPAGACNLQGLKEKSWGCWGSQVTMSQYSFV